MMVPMSCGARSRTQWRGQPDYLRLSSRTAKRRIAGNERQGGPDCGCEFEGWCMWLLPAPGDLTPVADLALFQSRTAYSKAAGFCQRRSLLTPFHTT